MITSSQEDAAGVTVEAGEEDVVLDGLLRRLPEQDRRAIARVMSIVEQGGRQAALADAAVWSAASSSHTIGITGAPGAGKSTLTSALVGHLRSTADPVAVLAIDPSSPLSGGAILGDRVRMQMHALDPGVYIRSMASRGNLGGLARAVPQAVRVLEAARFPWILLETVGVGQAEVDVATAADTTIVVVNPGWGDDVQANKAGLLEIADIFVVNKADRDGAHKTRAELEQMLGLGLRIDDRGWRPPVVSTVASTGQGVEDLWEAVLQHRRFLLESEFLADDRRTRAGRELQGLFAQTISSWAHDRIEDELLQKLAAQVLEGEIDAARALQMLKVALDAGG